LKARLNSNQPARAVPSHHPFATDRLPKSVNACQSYSKPKMGRISDTLYILLCSLVTPIICIANNTHTIHRFLVYIRTTHNSYIIHRFEDEPGCNISKFVKTSKLMMFCIP